MAVPALEVGEVREHLAARPAPEGAPSPSQSHPSPSPDASGATPTQCARMHLVLVKQTPSRHRISVGVLYGSHTDRLVNPGLWVRIQIGSTRTTHRPRGELRSTLHSTTARYQPRDHCALAMCVRRGGRQQPHNKHVPSFYA